MIKNVKKCSACKREKDLTLFSKNRTNKTGHNNQCKACIVDYRSKNRVAINERLRKHRATTHGRAMQAYHKALAKSRQYGRTSTLTFETVLALFTERQHCAYCAGSLCMTGDDASKASLEHVFSLVSDYGGVNHEANLQIVCLQCNKQKGNRHVYDYYQRSDAFTAELWHTFVKDFTERLLNRPISAAEVAQMSANLAAEAAESGKHHENIRK